ncbi:isochorismatase family protein [Kineosporia sp. A_224]|uniref:isochorismatase family protein n=1 Tax=Kineosporia sp. A_224 TaxID=1962180 RepID=UPI000B4BD8CB|nr:isochorismatase family protein [Kineosporia sp. A_224]
MTRALIVIDVQDSFLQREAWAATNAPDIVERVGRLVEHARSNSDLVVWVLHSEPGSGGPFDPASGHVRLMSGLEPRPGEPVLTKVVHNAFTTTNLQHLLTQNEIHDLTICGIRTEQCCETTARLASDLGYRVTFVADATATTPIEHPDAPAGRSLAEVLADPLTLQADEIVRRTVYALAGRFADVVTVDDVVGAAAGGRDDAQVRAGIPAGAVAH